MAYLTIINACVKILQKVVFGKETFQYAVLHFSVGSRDDSSFSEKKLGSVSLYDQLARLLFP